MPDLHRLESANSNPLIGGVLITWPDHRGIEIAWQSDGRLILPTLDAAKRYAAETIAELQRTGRQDLIDATSWASLVAALQRHIDAFNTGIRNTWTHSTH
jgi:hypothetical protein